VETAARLRERVGVHLGPVVVNGLYPEVAGIDAADELITGADVPADDAHALRAAAAFRQARYELQQEQVGRLADGLDLPQLRLPFLFSPELGPSEVDVLAASLADAVAALETAS
ncbi:MAG: hypothetical protein JO148_06555, partial [Acidimicrobiia bacterium]|nr:hypothetical protein [Acidimicrobiia bacterium]